MADKPDVTTLQVRGEDALEACKAVFSNFLAISRVGTEVQFEFVFLDLNVVANILQAVAKAESKTVPEIVGKTAAKIVMPAASVLQIKEHFLKLLEDIEAEISGKKKEAQNEYNRAR